MQTNANELLDTRISDVITLIRHQYVNIRDHKEADLRGYGAALYRAYEKAVQDINGYIENKNAPGEKTPDAETQNLFNLQRAFKTLEMAVDVEHLKYVSLRNNAPTNSTERNRADEVQGKVGSLGAELEEKIAVLEGRKPDTERFHPDREDKDLSPLKAVAATAAERLEGIANDQYLTSVRSGQAKNVREAITAPLNSEQPGALETVRTFRDAQPPSVENYLAMRYAMEAAIIEAKKLGRDAITSNLEDINRSLGFPAVEWFGPPAPAAVKPLSPLARPINDLNQLMSDLGNKNFVRDYSPENKRDPNQPKRDPVKEPAYSLGHLMQEAQAAGNSLRGTLDAPSLDTEAAKKLMTSLHDAKRVIRTHINPLERAKFPSVPITPGENYANKVDRIIQSFADSSPQMAALNVEGMATAWLKDKNINADFRKNLEKVKEAAAKTADAKTPEAWSAQKADLIKAIKELPKGTLPTLDEDLGKATMAISLVQYSTESQKPSENPQLPTKQQSQGKNR